MKHSLGPEMLPWWKPLSQLQLVIPAPPALDSASWLEFVGTALTALIAAAIGAYATGHVTRRANDAQFKRLEFERDSSAAFAMQQKIVRIYSSAISLRSDFLKAQRRQKLRRSQFLSLNLRPFANPPSTVTFSSEELERINRIGGHDLLNLVADLDIRYNAILESMTIYRDRWIQLTDGWDGFVTNEGLLSTERTRDELEKDFPRLYLLDNLAAQSAVFTEELVHIAYAAMLDLYFARGAHLNLRQRMETITPSGAKVTIQSMPFEKKKTKENLPEWFSKRFGNKPKLTVYPLYGSQGEA